MPSVRSIPETALEEVRGVHRMLIEEVQPHEEAEEQELYPALGRFFGGSDPMATMSRAHVEITHQIRRLGQLIDDIGPDGIDEVDLTELRSLLYGLHAILKLHTAQEDENYLSLAEEPKRERGVVESRVMVVTFPFDISWGAISFTVFEGIANPSPGAAVDPLVAASVGMPTTWLDRSISAPPLFPGLIAALVWTRSGRTAPLPSSTRDR